MFGSKKKQPLPRMEDMIPQPQTITLIPRLNMVQENEYRPCYVNGRRGLFHRWANTAKPSLPRGQEPDENARYFQYRSTKAIVEFEDGTVENIWPQDLRFADGGHFKDYAWIPLDALLNSEDWHGGE